MKKKIIRILIASFLIVTAILAYRWYTGSKVKPGTKEVTISVIDSRSDQDIYLMDKQTYTTDANFLGEVLDEINQKEPMFVFEGKKSDTFGRFLVEIKGVKQNPNTNSYWFYESTTNPTCQSVGYCAGVDQLPINDQDVFTFIIE